jgi:LysM repeat protein
MNTPNPLVPQGALPEPGQRKSQVRLIVFSILAIHVVLLGALLIQGCKREDQPPPPPLPLPQPETNPTPVTPLPTNPPPVTTSNLPPIPGPTNVLESTDTPKVHEIAKGETFEALSKKYGVPVKAIQAANPGVDSKLLKIGQKINIPAKTPSVPKPPTPTPKTSSTKPGETELLAGESVYTVKKGDTLTSIAKANNVSWKAIRTANSLKTTAIKEGQKLKLPTKTATGTPAAPAGAGAPAALPSGAPMSASGPGPSGL